MCGALKLRKIRIKNFRSIEDLTLKNISDLNVLVGRNESGKTNILKALVWFSTDDPISEKDKPQFMISLKLNDKETFVETVFEVTNPEDLIKKLNSIKLKNILIKLFSKKIIFGKSLFEILLKDKILIFKWSDIEKKISKISYVKITKYGNGEKEIKAYDNRLNEIIFDDILNLQIDKITPLIQYIITAIIISWQNWDEVESSIVDPFNERSIPNLIREIVTEFSRDVFEILIKRIERNKLKSPSGSTNDEYVPFFEIIQHLVEIDLGNLFLDYLNNKGLKLSKIISMNGYYIRTSSSDLIEIDQYFKDILQVRDIYLYELLKQYIPQFILLSESFNLTGVIKKNPNRKWSEILKENSEEYGIVYRWLTILGIKPNEIDDKIKESTTNVSMIIKNALIPFTEGFKTIWTQENIKFDCNVSINEISFFVVDLLDNNKEIMNIAPEERSRGFNWYLAYYITLEYIKNNKNSILLLDDPGVYLHFKGQEDFLNELKKLSSEIQIIYSTHLIGLIDIDNLDNVYLIKKVEGKTIVNRPWLSKQDLMETPIYQALGFSYLIFKDVKKILLVEGISDKFILEGLKKYNKKLKEWFIYPLFGGDKPENNKIRKKIEKISCLVRVEDIQYKVILDGDKVKEYKDKLGNSENEGTSKRNLTCDYNLPCFLGSENEELEDLIDREFYLNQIIEYYKIIFLDKPEKYQKLVEIINSFKSNKVTKVTKHLTDLLKKEDIILDKVGVAIKIKRELHKNKTLLRYFERINKELNKYL